MDDPSVRLLQPGARQSGPPFPASVTNVTFATVAFAGAHGHRPLSGLILAVIAVGSAAGGLWYGARNWKVAEHRRFAVIQVLSACAVGVLWLAPNIAVLCFLVLLTGTVTSPTFIASYSILEQQALPGRDNEALSWIGSANCAGAALGAALTGWAVDADGARGGYLVAAGCAALAAIVCLAGLPLLRQREAAPAEPVRVPG